MQNTRPTATSFGTIVRNLTTTMTTRESGYWTTFMAGSAPLDVTVADGRLYLYLEDDSRSADVDRRPVCIEAVAIIPNRDADEPEQWDVIGDRMFEGRRVALASFKGLDAAIGFALERVCARNWYAGAQDQHDPVAV
jgi:hypothetical protein